MSSYQIGVTEANMQDLTDLRLPDPLYEPLSDYVPFSDTRIKGDGTIVGVGKAQITWRFNELTLTQMGTLLYYCSTAGTLVASKTVYIKTRVPDPDMTDRVFKTFQARMLLPIEPSDLQYDINRKYRNVSVRFVQAEEV
jgi:hypothetical protein